MSGQIQVIKKKTLSDKMHLMADTLRNCTEKQCIGKFYDPRNDSVCAYGALGFMAGIPKDDLKKQDFTKVLASYGIDLDESGKLVILPNEAMNEHGYYPQRESSLFQSIFQLNDKGYSFKEIASYLDIWADNI